MSYQTIRWVQPGYNGTVPRLEIDGVLHSRMFEIGDAADQACGDTIAMGKHPICYHVMELYRQQNPGMCKLVPQGRAKQWGWYVPVVAELAVERFSMNPRNRASAKGKMFGLMAWAKKQKALKEAAEQPTLFTPPPAVIITPPVETVPPGVSARPVRIVATGIDWTDKHGRVFRGFDVQLPLGSIVSLRGADQFIRIRDFIEASGRRDASLNSEVSRIFSNKVLQVHPKHMKVPSSKFLHHSAIPECLNLLESRAKLRKDNVTQLRTLFGVAA